MHNKITPNLRLRPLLRADIADAARLAADAFDSEAEGAMVQQMLTIHCNTVDNIAMNQQNDVLVATEYYVLCDEQTKSIIGLSGLYRSADAHPSMYSLGWFCIAPTRQRQGLGRLLLEATLHKAISLGGRRMIIETWPGAIAALPLYAKLGFEECGRVPDYYGDDLPLMLLTRSLEGAHFDLPKELLYEI